jgi:hypothetical protein
MVELIPGSRITFGRNGIRDGSAASSATGGPNENRDYASLSTPYYAAPQLF